MNVFFGFLFFRLEVMVVILLFLFLKALMVAVFGWPDILAADVPSFVCRLV